MRLLWQAREKDGVLGKGLLKIHGSGIDKKKGRYAPKSECIYKEWLNFLQKMSKINERLCFYGRVLEYGIRNVQGGKKKK